MIGVYNHLLRKVFRFHAPILNFGEPGSLGRHIMGPFQAFVDAHGDCDEHGAFEEIRSFLKVTKIAGVQEVGRLVWET